MPSKAVAIALAGGTGERAKPLSRTSSGVRSKAVVKFLGRPVIAWQAGLLHEQGIDDMYVAARGHANRYQIKDVLRYGDGFGVRVAYSRVQDDLVNTGSGSATINGIRQWGLTDTAVIVPTDSVFDCDVAAMVARHRASRSVVTVGALRLAPREVADKYGVIVPGRGGACAGFVEKPSLAEAERLGAADGKLWTSAGLYLVDCGFLALLAAHGPLAERRLRSLDWGFDLLPWLVANGYPVAIAEMADLGDLGTPTDYLATMRDTLAGRFPRLRALCGLDDRTATIHPETLARRDANGRTLADRLARGAVTVGPHVRIGRDVEIGSGSVVHDSDVGDGVTIGAGVSVRGSSVHEDAVIGDHAEVCDSYVGAMAVVGSGASDRTRLTGCSLGDESDVAAGSVFDRRIVESR